MTRARLFLLATLCAVWFTPSPAYAEAGWWDWLEELSGPGPFSNGVMLNERLACKVQIKTDTARRDAADESTVWVPFWRKVTDDHGSGLKCLTNANSVRGYIELRGGWITSDKDKPLFVDVPNELRGQVTAHTIQGLFMRQFDPALAIGAGAGWIWFSGDNLDRHPGRFAFTPISVAFMPLKVLLRGSAATKAGFITFHAEETAIIGGLKAADFNSRSTSSFRRKSEVVRSISVTFDVFALTSQ